MNINEESFELDEPVVLYLATPLRRGVRNCSKDRNNSIKMAFTPNLRSSTSMSTIITDEPKMYEVNQQKDVKESQNENIKKDSQKEKKRYQLQRNKSQNIVNPFKEGMSKTNKNESNNNNKGPQMLTQSNISIINNSINYFNCNKENNENISQKLKNKKYSDNNIRNRNKINNNNVSDNQTLNKSIISISETSDYNENNNNENKKKRRIRYRNYKIKKEDNDGKQKIFIDDPDSIVRHRKKSCFNPSKSKNGGPLIPLLSNMNVDQTKKIINKEKEKYKPKIISDEAEKAAFNRKISKNILEIRNERKKRDNGSIISNSSKNSLPIEITSKKQTTKSKEKFQLQLSKIKTEKILKEKYNSPSSKKEKKNKMNLQFSKNNNSSNNNKNININIENDGDDGTGGSRCHKKKHSKESEQGESIRNEKRSSTLKCNKSQFQSDDKRKYHEKKPQNKLHSTNKVSNMAQTKNFHIKNNNNENENNNNNNKEESEDSNKDEKKVKKSKKSKPKARIKSKKKGEEDLSENNKDNIKDNNNNHNNQNYSSRSSIDIKKVKAGKNNNFIKEKEKEKSSSKNDLTSKMNFQQKILESNSTKINPTVETKTTSSSIYSCKTMKDSKIKKILEENTKKVESRLSCENQNPEIEPFTNTEIKKDSNTTDYKEYTFNCLELILDLEKEKKEEVTSKINFNFTGDELKKKKIALFDIDETLIHCTGNVKTKGNIPHQKEIYIALPNNQKVKVGVNIRPYWKEALDMIIDKYNIVAFTASHQAYADSVLESIDPDNQYFKYRLYRNNCSLKIFNGSKLYIKDLDILKDNYNLKDVVIIDNSVLSFAYHLNNGIPIVPYYDRIDDEYLLLIAIYLSKIAECDDLREKNKQIYNLEGMKKEVAEDLEDSGSSLDNMEQKENSTEKIQKIPSKNKEENKNNEKSNNEKKEENNNENIKKNKENNENNENDINDIDRKLKKISSDSDIKKIDYKNVNNLNRKSYRRKSEDFGDLSNNVDKKSQMFKIYADFGKEKHVKPDLLKEEYKKDVIEEVDEENATERDKEQHITPQSSKGINSLHDDEENSIEKNNKKNCHSQRNANAQGYHSDNDEKEEVKTKININVIKEMPKVNKKPLKSMKSMNFQTNLNFFNGFSQNAKMTVVSNQLDILLSDK